MSRVVAIAFLVLAFNVPAVIAQPPALPEGKEATPLELRPVQIEPGEVLSVAGGGCDDDVDVYLELYNPTLISRGITRSDADGAFAAEVEIPASSVNGRAWVRARCESASQEMFLEGVAVVSRSPYALTWINLVFGAGTFLMVLGLGLIIRRTPGHRRRPKRRFGSRRRRSRSQSGQVPHSQ